MKIVLRILFVVFACAVIGSAPRLYAQSFEGTVTEEMAVPAMGIEKIPVIISMKGGKSMTTMDIPVQGAINAYYDKSSNTLTIVTAANKRGKQIDMTMVETLEKQNLHTPAPSGKKETIKGFASEEYIVPVGAGAELSLWLTKAMPKDTAAILGAAFESALHTNMVGTGAFKDLLAKNYVPVRMQIKKDGEEQVSMDYIKTESKKIDDQVFTIPSDIDIKKIDLPVANPNSGNEQSASQPSDTAKSQMKAVTPEQKK